MEYFEFLHGSRIICLPSNISDKLHRQYAFGKLEKAETYCLHLRKFDTIPKHPVTTIIFSSGYQSCNCSRSGLFCWQTRALVVTVELCIQEAFKCIQVFKKYSSVFKNNNQMLLFLNTLSFKFVPTPRKSLRFTRFRRTYANRPAVVLTKYCQSYTAFFG